MTSIRWAFTALLLAAACCADAQQRPLASHIGYLFPAGGRQGSTVEVTVGGQLLGATSGVHVSGKGIAVSVAGYDRPLNQREVQMLRDRIEEARKKLAGDAPGRARAVGMIALAKEAGITDTEIRKLMEFQRRFTDPKKQLNPQIEEKITLQVTIDANAEPGPREIRLLTAAGMSNPLAFEVGTLRECTESEPNDHTPDSAIGDTLPAVVNGQILPGDVDRFSFKARKGQQIVALVHARELIPYLADAVPGWFQPVAAIYDAKGHELAYAGSFRFQQDPVLCCQIPADGSFVLEIHDSLYRGREDFVYRVELGELPYITSIFPLGGRTGSQSVVKLAGWNLPASQVTMHPAADGAAAVCASAGARRSNSVPFVAGALPERTESEPNNDPAHAQAIQLTCVINGRIDKPGDADVFRFQGRAGQEIVAEVEARRLGSPLDSVIELTDAKGRRLALNDDCEDKSCGLLTHHADSRIQVKLAASGAYFVTLRDAQRKGGPEYAYRLRVSEPRPDFALRVSPSGLVARAGTTVAVTVYAFRQDGFDGDIALELKDAPPGFTLGGAWLPAGQEKVRVTLTAPGSGGEPVPLQLEGRAVVAGREVRRPAVPAEDMMQAFAYHHLVPTQEWLVQVTGRAALARAEVVQSGPLKLMPGGTARVIIRAPLGSGLLRTQLALSDPPDGITLQRSSLTAEGLALDLACDSAKVKPGLKGNLIVEAYTPVASAARPNATRRIPITLLPAIPFEVLASTSAR